jgi:DNA-binding NarL/FixJ family response regulator
MRDLQPDIIFISITLVENIKPAERLIQKIRQKYNNRLPIIVGGSAFNMIDQNQENRINAFLMKNASFDDIMNLVQANIHTIRS